MKRLFLVSCCFISILSFSQNNPGSIILHHAASSQNNSSTIYYLDSSFTFHRRFKNLTDNGRLEGMADGQTTNFKFTRKEIRYLDAAFKNQKIISWPDSMFTESQRVNQKDIRNMWATCLKDSSYDQCTKKRFFIFSEPVFLRNNTVAIFRMARMLISYGCGYDYIFIYEKVNGIWEQKLMSIAGAW